MLEEREAAPFELRALVYSTMPKQLNTNARLVNSVSEAVVRLTKAEYHVGPYTPATAVDAIEHLRPDLVIGFGGLMFDQVDLSVVHSACKRNGAFHAIWTHDDPYEIDYRIKAEVNSDWIFTNDRASVRYYGSDKVSHLPLAADKERHFGAYPAFADRPIDFFFCGHGYPNRRSMIDHLAPLLSKHNTVILGSGWDQRYSFCTNRRIEEKELISFYRRSKFTLNLGRVFNLANKDFGVVPSTPGPRTFEAAAVGALQLCFRDGFEIDEYYPDGVGVAFFDNLSSLERAWRAFNKDPSHADAVIKAGVERTRLKGTFDTRVGAAMQTISSHVAGRSTRASSDN